MRDATLSDYHWLYAHRYMDSSRPWQDPPLLWLIDKAPRRVLDVGSGNGTFLKWMSERFHGIDAVGVEPSMGHPALPSVPDALHSECVTCFDVLEHIPEADIGASIDNLRRLTERIFVCSIANMSDVHTVNGERVELHITRKDCAWWRAHIVAAFAGWDITLRPLHYAERFWFTAEAP